MKDISFFLSLLRVLDETAETLGLDHLNESDKIILQTMWIAAEEKRNNSFSLSYGKFKRLLTDNQVPVSRAQFYKTIKNLEESGSVSRVNGERSGTYVFL